MKINPGVYLITDPMYPQEKIIQALEANVKYLQIRNKKQSSLDFYKQALLYREITLKKDIPLIINDRLDIALAVDADGLHIGQDDLPLELCRKLLPNKIIGVSVSNLEEAKIAQKAGADYLGLGAMYKTKTKTDAKSVSLEQLIAIKKQIKIPIVCIGGINLENIDCLLSYGIKTFAVISDILKRDNPGQQVIRYNQKILEDGKINEITK